MTDGVDHINIYSKGETKLGRDLSNFAALSVSTLDGPFASLESYWYWLSCPPTPEREKLRHLTGYEAKSLGRALRGNDYSTDPLFKLKIVHAMVGKLLMHPALCEAFRESTLPFRHYYVYGGGEVTPENGQWVVEIWETLRRLMRDKSS
jgi:hypothetical protein